MGSEKRPYVRRDLSHLGWFDGEITVDTLSQHILNITFHVSLFLLFDHVIICIKESKGTLLGNVFSSEARERTDYSFSV